MVNKLKKTKKKKKKIVKTSRKIKSKKKVKTKKVGTKKSATKKPLKKSRRSNNIKNNKKRGEKKMSAEALKVSSALDTSHLKVEFPYKAKYGNFINGKFVEPLSGKYFDNPSPISNEIICSVARSNEKDVEAALDAAHAAFPEWGKTDITTRSIIRQLQACLYFVQEHLLFC
jgi:aldehyde dehydrogenase